MKWAPHYAEGLAEFDLCGSKDKSPRCELFNASKMRLVHEDNFKSKSYRVEQEILWAKFFGRMGTMFPLWDAMKK